MKIVDYLLVHYLWLLIVCLPALTLVGWKTYALTSDFFSADDPHGFRDDRDPAWFLHTTDLNLDARIPSSYSVVAGRLGRALSLLHPQKIFVSGGVVSNAENQTHPQYKRQHSDDWALYELLLSDLRINRTNFFVVAGDSEVFGVSNFDSPQNFARLLFGSSESDYRTQVSEFEIAHDRFRVLLLNPYDFPTPPYGLVRWAYPSLEHRRQIRSRLMSDDNAITIVLTHHPAMLWNPSFDTSRVDTMRRMLVAATNTRFFLSGHIDPEFPVFMHHGNVLEVIGAPLMNYARVGVVTFDNHHAVYHTVELDSEKVILLTCPVPVAQISGRDVFNQQNFSVRALVFGSDNVTLYIEGSITGQLKKQRMVGPNISLWALPCIELPYGKHKIQMSGDWYGECEFLVGNTMVGFNEPNYLREGNAQNHFLFVWFFLFAIVIALPVNIRGIADSFDKSRHPKDGSWLTIFFGFFIIKRRIRQMPNFFQILFFLATIWPIAFPIAFFTSESLIGITWLYGYVCDWKQFPLVISALLGFSYLGFVITPIALLASSYMATKFKHPIIIVDLIVYSGGLGANGWIVYMMIDELGLLVGLTSPCFIIIPAILHLSLWFFIVQMLILSSRASDEPLM